MKDFFNLFQDFLTIVSPFILAYLAYRATKKEKEETKYNKLLADNLKLEKELEDSKQKELDDVIVGLQSDVQSLKSDINEIRKDLSSLSKEVKSMSCALKDLLKFNSVNLDYSQSLSGLITTIGENIRHGSDCASNESIKKAIETHQQKERELFNKILKSSC